MKLIAVTNDQHSTSDLIDILVNIEPFIDGVIVREKSKSEQEVLELIQGLKVKRFDTGKIIVHSKVHLAFDEKIKKVQLPGKSPPLAELKQQYPNLSFGKSVHSLQEAKDAANEGSSALLYGHVFDTLSKQGLPARGTDELWEITSTVDIPVFAIGGIQPMHIKQLKRINVAGIAVLSSIFNSDNPREVAKSYYDEIRRGDDGNG